MPKLKPKKGSGSSNIKDPATNNSAPLTFEKPVFSLQYLCTDRAYDVEHANIEDQAAFAKRIAKLSQMSWNDIRQAPRHGLGSEIIAREAINVGIPSHITEDVNLLAFRFNGMKPMIGYRCSRGVFHVLWLDRDYTIYNH